MPNPFYNHEERRLRAFWRLVLQFLLFAVGTSIAGAIGGAIAGGLAALQDPALLESPEALIQTIMGSPSFRVIVSIGSLLAVLVSTWLAARFLDRRPYRQFGLRFSRGWWLDLLFGLALGALLMAAVFVVQVAAGWARVTGTFVSYDPGQPFIVAFAAAIVAFICVGIYEELQFRGYQLLNGAEGLNLGAIGPRGAVLLAWLLSSAFFGVAHATNPNATVISTVNLALAGLFLGLGFVLTGELAIPIGLHITWNLFQGNVFGFPVSGLRAGGTIVAVEDAGPALWTGGAFGPEAGLIGIAAILAGSALTLLWVRRRHGRLDLDARLAAPPHAADLHSEETP